jgi:hypothetical protein
MSRLAAAGDLTRELSLPRPPVWLIGWWAAGRLLVVVTAAAIRPSVWTFDLWDGRWYDLVARDGYLFVPGRLSDPAFFPLYPILLRGVHALGAPWAIAGSLLSNLAFPLALALFYGLTREMFGESLARRATIYLAIFPLGYVFSMAYPESVALVFVAAAPLAAIRRRWWLAAVCAAAAGLTRPEALFLVLPLAGIAWQQRRALDAAGRGAALAAVLAPAAGGVAFPLYLASVLNDPLAWTRAQHAWHRSFGITRVVTAFNGLPSHVSTHPLFVREARDAAFFLLYLGLLFVAWRIGTPLAWLAVTAGVVVLPVFSGSFTSIARFGLLAPPLFWALAGITRSVRAERAVQALSLVLLVLATLSIGYVFP